MFSKMSLIAAAVSAHGHNGLLTADDYKFMDFVSQQGRSYGTMAEFKFRANIFAENLKEIAEFNASQNTSTVGINKFSDRTKAEMRVMNGYRGAGK